MIVGGSGIGRRKPWLPNAEDLRKQGWLENKGCQKTEDGRKQRMPESGNDETAGVSRCSLHNDFLGANHCGAMEARKPRRSWQWVDGFAGGHICGPFGGAQHSSLAMKLGECENPMLVLGTICAYCLPGTLLCFRRSMLLEGGHPALSPLAISCASVLLALTAPFSLGSQLT